VKGSAPDVAMEAPAEDPTVNVRQVGSAHEEAVLIAPSGGSRTPPTTVTAAKPKPEAGSGSAAPEPKGPPSAVQLGKLYSSVGRELKTLEAKKGEDATIDLWPRYRWIRINDEMSASPERRGVVADMLELLHHDIHDAAK
jgi:hypothetical protein